MSSSDNSTAGAQGRLISHFQIRYASKIPDQYRSTSLKQEELEIPRIQDGQIYGIQIRVICGIVANHRRLWLILSKISVTYCQLGIVDAHYVYLYLCVTYPEFPCPQWALRNPILML